MDKKRRIFVASHRGLVGSTVCRRLEKEGYANLFHRTHTHLELADRDAVSKFFCLERPKVVFLAAAKAVEILANHKYSADFIREDLETQTNVIGANYRFGVKRLLLLGSSCIYPKHAQQRIKEERLRTGPPAPTNRAYELTTIAGIEMHWSYNRPCGTEYLGSLPIMVCGTEAKIGLQNSHIQPALMRTISEAKLAGSRTLVVWGTGKPLINIGTGEDLLFRELAEFICNTLGLDQDLVFDVSRSDGTPRKLLDASKVRGLGWKTTTSLDLRRRITCESVRPRVGALVPTGEKCA